MSKKVVKKISSVMLAFGLMLSSVTVNAESTNYSTTNGVATVGSGNASISLKLNYDGETNQSIKDKKFEVYKLLNAENSVDGESINYTFNTECEEALKTVIADKINKDSKDVTIYDTVDYIQSLNTNPVEGANASQELEGNYSDFRYFVEEVRTELANEKCSSIIISVSDVKVANDGSTYVELKGLDSGYYIVDEVSENTSTHSASSLCMVGTSNPNVSLTLKSDYPSVIKKIEEDDNNVGWNDIGDYEINQVIPYKFVSHVPDMDGYDEYFYSFHDRMDSALTFDKNTVKIKISDDDKTYTLVESEYRVLDGLTNGETFKVDIADLKAIVDREFGSEYGQEIELTYNAKLNETASNKTGRPGFENSVKLEFSNDPDADGVGKTGETPWDTVVCFTYRLDGLKVNTEDKVLEGAKFRLYRDADCTDEVILKQTTDGYVVVNELEGYEGITSNENGVFNIIGLDSDNYFLKEVKAPAGYSALKGTIEVEINSTFTEQRNSYVEGDGATDKTLISLSMVAKTKFLMGTNENDLVTDVENGSGNLVVVNEIGSLLPMTGSSVALLLVVAGTFLMLIALLNKKSKDA